MRIINGKQYYTTGDVAKKTGRQRQTVVLWDRYSEELERFKEKRFIPKAIRVHGIRYWTEKEVEQICKFASSIEPGDLARFSRKQWGKRGEKIVDRIKLEESDVDRKRVSDRIKAMKSGQKAYY